MTTTKPDSRYLLGIDTGSSKTHALVATSAGEVVGFGEAGSGNYEVVGLSGFKKALQTSTEAAMAMAGATKAQILGMGLGIAGYDWPGEKPVMVEAIESLAIPAPFQFVNDAVIGLIAGAEAGWGVAVDAGTGNNVRGRNQAGEMGRITGNSVACYEFGGAGELVWRAGIAVIHAWTQRGPQTALTQIFLDYAEVDSEDRLIEMMAMRQMQFPPTLALEVFRLAAEGDAVAQDVIDWTAGELGHNVNAVIRQIDLREKVFDIVLIGSLFNAGEAYIQPLRRTVQAFAPGANLIRLAVPPVIGALLLAAETAGLSIQKLRRPLINSTRKNFQEDDPEMMERE
jgi:N-acetylglucosamine kinase-like BadF-type ATPase